MKFPSLPKGMDPVFYRALRDWAKGVQDQIDGMYAVATGSLSKSVAVPPATQERKPYILWELAADTTLTTSDLNTWHYVNCSSAATLTLPDPVEGSWIGVQNYGTQVITFSSAATGSRASIPSNGRVLLNGTVDSSGVPQWDKIVVVGPSTEARYQSDIAFTDATKGIILKDAAATPHYWRVTIDTLGALVTTDLGTSLPSL